MLKLHLKEQELFNSVTNEFYSEGEALDLEMEHSLLSMSKWESIFEKPFLAAGEKSKAEIMGYLGCMILNPDVDPSVVDRFSQAEVDLVDRYINSKQSATTFGELPPGQTRGRVEIITTELIYYWMVAFEVPFECETWHLSRLFALIRILNLKQSKDSKPTMSKAELSARNAQLNAERRAQYNTTG